MSTELNIYSFGAAKQSVKGTAITNPSRRFRVPTGDLATARDQGSENVSDGSTAFGDAVDWVNNVQGSGQVGVQWTPDEAAWLLTMFNGGEVVTANATLGTLNDHKCEPGAAQPFYTTWFKSQGVSTKQIMRHVDTLITQIQIEASTANKAMRISPSLLSLDPGEKINEPTWPAMPVADKVLLYTEAVGTFEIDTVIVRGHSQFTVVLNQAIEPVYTDDVRPYETQRGTPSATIACTIQADADGLAQWNKYLYGTATPTAGTKPIKTLPAMGSYEFLAQRGTGAGLTQAFHFEAPGVRWNLPEWPAPNPDGGASSLSLAGNMRITTGNPLWRTIVTCASAAFTT